VQPLDPDELRTSLERITSERVEVRETHVSVVLLTRDRAFKLKKPVVLPFLDYGTPARRRAMCTEEVRLNQRLAPGIYLGVRGVVRGDVGLELRDDDDPDAIDYVVAMRRYDERHTLAAMLARGELTRGQMIAVGELLADFHARCTPADGSHGGARIVELEVMRNVAQLLEVAELHSERERIHSLARFMTAFLGARADVFDGRAAQGLIREVHGDLRAEHVVIEGERISVVDCVEFDRELRTLDVADDLAFLVMDLTALGGEHVASQLLDAYRAAGGQCGDAALVAFFAAHRALVRAKVLLVRAGQYPQRSSAHGRAGAQARELLTLAERYAWRARLPLAIVVCGVPASGKSTLAAAVAEAARVPRISSDLLRKRLAGIRPTTRASAERYSEQFNRATYAELGHRAAALAAAQGGVVIDATFRRRADRDAFAAAFDGAAPLVFVECEAPVDVLRERAMRRERDPTRVSDATVEVVIRERSSWEPLDEVPPGDHLCIRTDRPIDRISAELIALLDLRLAR